MRQRGKTLYKIEMAAAIINLCLLFLAFAIFLFYKQDLYYFPDVFLTILALISDIVMFLHLFCATFSDPLIKNERKLRLVWVLTFVLSLIGFLLFSGLIKVYTIVPYLIGLFVILFIILLILSIFYSKGKRLRGLYVFTLMLPIIYTSVISLIVFAVDAPQILFFYIAIFIFLFFPFSIADLITSRRQYV